MKLTPLRRFFSILKKSSSILAFLISYIFINTTSCSLLQKLGEKSATGYDRRGGLLRDSSFEEKDEWRISAPPGYSENATLDFDRKIRHAGRQSAHVLIFRHPRNDNLKIMHAWTQETGAIKAGARVKFGGWVRAATGTTVMLSLKCEFEKPINGKRYVTVFAEQPAKTGSFQYIEKVVALPKNTASMLSVYAGLNTLGEAWFDDVFVRILKK